MTTKVGTTGDTLPWQSLKSFTASTTLSEKVWRIVNNLLFVAGGLSLYTLARRTILPPTLSYASYVILALTVRKIASTIIGYAVYPAAFSFVYANRLAETEQQQFNKLHKQGYVTQKITLHKSGTAYNATLIGHKDAIANRKWTIYALGNGMAMENYVEDLSSKEANILLINGPSVGRSKGYPTRYQMGAGFEAGLQLLEKEVKASHIAFHGLSLGGGMISEAIQIHEFDSNVNYLGIFDRTFSYLSALAAELAGFFVHPFLTFCTTPLFYLSGAELDTVSGAEKLKKLKIKHLIIQHTGGARTDGLIPDNMGLASSLDHDPKRTFLLSPDIDHSKIPENIWKLLTLEIQNFFKSEAIASERI